MLASLFLSKDLVADFLCALQTMKTKNKPPELAKSATRAEIFDNTVCWIRKAKQEAAAAGHELLVSWDNASIHGFSVAAGDYTEFGIDKSQHIVLPPRSPDLHQVIEHQFGQLKAGLVAAMYARGWNNINAFWVVEWVLRWCESISAASVQAQLQKLPKLYRAVSTPKGQHVMVDDERIEGTGGYYAKHNIS